jgi:hypothetical protein
VRVKNANLHFRIQDGAKGGGGIVRTPSKQKKEGVDVLKLKATGSGNTTT